MKRCRVAVCLVTVFTCSGIPPGGEIVSITNSSTLLLARDEYNQRHQFMADVRDHSIDVVIAGFYLLGSGFPGTTQEVQWVANTVASVLWLVDSCVRITSVCRKRLEAKRATGPGLCEIVVDQ